MHKICVGFDVPFDDDINPNNARDDQNNKHHVPNYYHSPSSILALVIKTAAAHAEHHAVHVGSLLAVGIATADALGAGLEAIVTTLLAGPTGLVAGVPLIAAGGVLLVAATAGHHHHAAAHLGAALGHELGAGLLDGGVSLAAPEVGAGLVAESGHVAEIGHVLFGKGGAEEAEGDGGEGSHHAGCWRWFARRRMSMVADQCHVERNEGPGRFNPLFV